LRLLHKETSTADGGIDRQNVLAMISFSTPNEAAASDAVTFTSSKVNTKANATGSSFWRKEKQDMPLMSIEEFAIAKASMKMVIKIMLFCC